MGAVHPVARPSVQRPILRSLIVAAPLVLFLGACAAGSAESQHAASGGLLPQLVLGFWHGVIAPITLLCEVINRLAPHALPWDLHMFETKAGGAPYDVGFYFGIAGGPAVLWSRRPRRRLD